MSKSKIYLDHAATTYTDPEVLKAMLPYFSEKFGNPGSGHEYGLEAKKTVDDARNIVAKIFNCKASEVVFTGSGTESNNIAILGVARANKEKGNHLITTLIEHSSVINCFRQLKKEGFTVTYLTPDTEGFISPDQLSEAITDETTLVSIIYANHEIGTIQDIQKLGQICKTKNICFHTDACQAAGLLTLNTEDLNVDLLTINAGKIYGPKGVGALFIKQETKIEPIIYGGNQERGLRSGTHNVAGIVGLAKALDIAQANATSESSRLTKLRDKLITSLLTSVPKAILNGPKERRLPNNVNISIPGINGREMILHFDEAGICISSSSTCKIKENIPSEVLSALGRSEELASGSIRLSLGKKTTESDIDYAIEKIPSIIKRVH